MPWEMRYEIQVGSDAPISAHYSDMFHFHTQSSVENSEPLIVSRAQEQIGSMIDRCVSFLPSAHQESVLRMIHNCCMAQNYPCDEEAAKEVYQFVRTKIESVPSMEAKPQLIREWYEISERRREFVIRTVKRFRQHASPNPFREVFRIHFVSQPTIVSRVTVATSAGFRVPRDYHAAFSRAKVASTTTGLESR